MANPFPAPPQASMTNFFQNPLQLQESSPLSAYSFLGTGQFPESVAFWHDPSTQPTQPAGLAAAAAPPPSSYATTTTSSNHKSLLQPTPDQKKHRRTRSGCFTCRSRRIKCDEARPVCDRCRKGSRECVYPSPSAGGSGSKSSASRQGSKPKGPRQQSRGSDSSPGPTESDDVRVLEPIADEEEESGSVGSHLSALGGPESSQFQLSTLSSGAQSSSGAHNRPNPQIHTSSTASSEFAAPRIDSSSSPPSTEASSRYDSMSARSASVGLFSNEPPAPPSLTHLSEDLRFYLTYHQEFVTYRHYFMKRRSGHFVHQNIIEYALQYEPLLYAVVGFASYHHCIQTGSGKLYSFLKYYNAALTALRKSLGSGELCEATLITVLVLTTFEECIGDWVNLIDHHQAAHALIRELLTPESITMNEHHSHIFHWYARFDVVAGILAGFETVLGRDWYLAKEEYDAQMAAKYPDDADKQMALAESINRRFGLEMASLYAKLSRGMIPIEEFMLHNDQLDQTLESVRTILESFNDSEWTVWEYPHRQPLTEEDFVDPYKPGGLHHGLLWDINFSWIDYLSTKAMFKYQSLLALKQSSFEELGALAVEQCRLIESIDRWPDKENGYMFAFKNSLPMASMFLPKDNKYIMWSRRKLAHMEQSGYVTAPKLRAGLAALFQVPEINHWWLPNDEGYSSIIREIRAMTEERTNNPRDDFRESVRDMKTLFWNINLNDTESENSPSSVGDQR